MRIILLALVFFCSTSAWAATGGSGLPIPRFVSLKNEETNIRTGPGTRYPIQWVYRRVGMPVEVVEEFDYWRKVRDMEGTSGWVHKIMIDGKRNAMITGKDPRILRIDADSKSKPLLKVEPTVVMRLMECRPEWCRVQISGRKGWIEKKYLWGVYKSEVFD